MTLAGSSVRRVRPARPARGSGVGPIGHLRQRGLSIVEMMVGIAVGMIVVAAATLMIAGQLADSRRLLLETQVQQDLRAAADLITREIRRAGTWKSAVRSTFAAERSSPPRLPNPYSGIVLTSTDGVAAKIELAYSHRVRPENNALDNDEQFGFRLDGGRIQAQLGGGNWQELTDPHVLRVTRFDIQEAVENVTLECHLACSVIAGSACPPLQQLRSYTVNIEGEAVHDATVRRSVRAQVRVRNDAVIGSCRD